MAPTGALSVDEMLPEAERTDFRRIDRTFQRQDDLLVIAVVGEHEQPSVERIARLEAALNGIPGVRWTWSSQSRPRVEQRAGPLLDVGLTRGPARPPSSLDRFLFDGERTRVVVADLSDRERGVEASRSIAAALERVSKQDAEPAERVLMLGEPHLHHEVADQIARDMRWVLPLLVASVVLVPLVVFRSFVAVVFPLAMAALTTALTLGAHRFVHGSVDPATVVLVPFAWAVATLDAIHLYSRYRLSAARGPAAARAARSALALPCFVTSLTTIAGLGALAMLSEAPILQLLGRWGALATALAWGLTFATGTAFLSALPQPRAMPPWSSRWLRLVVVASQRRAGWVLLAWAPILVFAGWSIRHVELGALYPDVFVPSHPVSTQLRALGESLRVELAPVEVYVEPVQAEAREPLNVVHASMALQGRLEKIPEVRLALSPGLFARELVQSDPSVLARAKELEGDRDAYERVVATAEEPGVESWVRFDDGISRAIVLLERTSIQRSEAIFAALREHDETAMPGYRYHFGGIGYFRQAMQQRIFEEMLRGVGATLVAVLLVLGVVLRSARYLLVATVANVAPIAFAAGIMVAFDVPWTLGIVAVPVVLLAIAVDDTVHLLWPLRHPSLRAPTGVARAVRDAGPALLATTLLLAACFATQVTSGFRLNHDLGLMLSLGLAGALLFDLTLVPAVLALTVSRRKAAR